MRIGKNVIFVRQEDGTGPHTNKTYIRYMEDEFKQMEWINFRQPSQSLILNTNNACFFSVISKAVTQEQGLSFGGRIIRGEELFETVIFWEDKKTYMQSSSNRLCNVGLRREERLIAGEEEIVVQDSEYFYFDGGW